MVFPEDQLSDEVNRAFALIYMGERFLYWFLRSEVGLSMHPELL